VLLVLVLANFLSYLCAEQQEGNLIEFSVEDEDEDE
jgi:hypothetical protein